MRCRTDAPAYGTVMYLSANLYVAAVVTTDAISYPVNLPAVR